MKKFLLLIAVVIVLTPSFSFAYDGLTSPETDTELILNANFLLKQNYQTYCIDAELQYDRDLADLDTQFFKFESQRMVAVGELNQKREAGIDKCNEVKAKLDSPIVYQINATKNISCGPGFVKRGGICITDTQSCQIKYGDNVTGVPYIGNEGISECTCTEGYTVTDGRCSKPIASLPVIAPAIKEPVKEILVITPQPIKKIAPVKTLQATTSKISNKIEATTTIAAVPETPQIAVVMTAEPKQLSWWDQFINWLLNR